MRSTMQRTDLTTGTIFAHGQRVYGPSHVVTCTGAGYREATFAGVAARARRLASALDHLGVRTGDRVATLCRNHQEHLEASFAVPGMGAVLHTLDIRLDQHRLAWIIGHAQDRVVIVDASLAPVIGPVFPELSTVEHVVVVGDGGLGLVAAIPYEELISGGDGDFVWPDLDEDDAASMCYTHTVAGDPKGVIYSHRSMFVHALAQCAGNAFGLNERDRILLAVPMSHANGWGLPYSGWMAGCDLVLPGPCLEPDRMARIAGDRGITVGQGPPSLWEEVRAHAAAEALDLSSLRLVISEELDYRARDGRLVAGVDARVVDASGRPLPWDGVSEGELELRGPWLTGSYFRDPSPEKFRDGWLRSGDRGTIDALGFVRLLGRAEES